MGGAVVGLRRKEPIIVNGEKLGRSVGSFVGIAVVINMGCFVGFLVGRYVICECDNAGREGLEAVPFPPPGFLNPDGFFCEGRGVGGFIPMALSIVENTGMAIGVKVTGWRVGGSDTGDAEGRTVGSGAGHSFVHIASSLQ